MTHALIEVSLMLASLGAGWAFVTQIIDAFSQRG